MTECQDEISEATSEHLLDDSNPRVRFTAQGKTYYRKGEEGVNFRVRSVGACSSYGRFAVEVE